MKGIRIISLFALAALLVMPAMAGEAGGQMTSAGALYSQSVDLANAGRYQEALDAADSALAMNVTSLTGLIQSNRAGILVMLDRNEEAVAAADAALAVEGNLKTVHSIAWYNKGNALKNLGRIDEARDAYDHAYALDNTLVPPEMTPSIPATAATFPATTATRSPLPAAVVIGALGIAGCLLARLRQE